MDGMLRKLEKMMEGAQNRRSLDAVYDDLNKITASYHFVYVLAYFINNDLRGSIEALYNKDIYEKISIKEFQFIARLWLKNSNRKDYFVADHKDAIEKMVIVRKLIDEMHAAVYLNPYEMITMSQEELSSDPSVFREAFFYASEPAYEKQFLNFAPEKYKYDKEWLLLKKNLDIDKSAMFYWRLSAILSNKATTLRQILSPSLEDVLNSCCITEEEKQSLFKGFESFFYNLTIEIGILENDNFNDIGDFNILQEKPIVRLKDGRSFITIPYAISEAIYTSPFYWMMKDDDYRKTASYNRGKRAEEIAFNLLAKIVPTDSLFKNVIISSVKGKSVTDIDILTVTNDSAIVFQVKSKALTELSRKGDIEMIKSDYNKAVRAAYNQGVICKECLLNIDKYSFSLSDVDLQRIKMLKNIYIVIILLEGYPGVIHQGQFFFDTKKENPPISWSIFDLDLIIKYLPDVCAFVDYIEKREIHSKLMSAENESVLLARYIETGFSEPDKEMGFVYDGTTAQKLDIAYHTERVNQSIRKVGRNELCPCGSGLKYKRCHGGN